MYPLVLALLACGEPGPKPDPMDSGDTSVDGDTATGAPCEPVDWNLDADGDGWGGSVVAACEAPAGHVAQGGDCDDADAAFHPDAVELCDGLDQDCDGTVDEGLATSPAAPDADGDGHGDASGVVDVCALPDGWTADVGDCDDANADVFPGQIEWCNGYDDDCDALVDDDDSPVTGPSTWYADADADGFGDADASDSACAAPEGYVATDGDCDDADAGVNPDAAEVCLDFVDQDCDGYTDDYSGDCSGAGGDGEGVIDLCDPAVVPVDVSACAAGVAAVLPTGATYTTVQGAIDDAVAGDVVSVCPGTWTEDLVQTVSPLSLAGYGAGTTVLEGAGGTVLSIGSGRTLTVVDLTLQSGSASDGGAISGSDATVCIARSSFAGNYATSNGGAVYLGGTGSLDIEDTIFYVNVADYAGGALAIDTYTTTIEDSTFYGNSSGYEAGAAEIDSTSVTTIARTDFTSNVSAYEAGALEYGGWGPGTTMDLTDVTFTSNTAGSGGGALGMGSWDDATVNCYACVFDANSAGYEGGAVNLTSWDAGTFNATLSTFTGNDSRSGGAINLGGWGVQTAAFNGCTFDANTAESGAAFALDTAGSAGFAAVTLLDSTVTSNVATSGGGASVARDYASLDSVNTDWGTGATENTPDDVVGYSAYGAAATFTCSGGTCL